MNQKPPWQSNQPPYGQQPPWYNQPTQLSPGQFQQPPYNPPPPGFVEWLKTRTRGVKIGLGCGTLVVIILFFSLVNAILFANSSTSATQATPTSTFAQGAVMSSPSATTIPATTPV